MYYQPRDPEVNAQFVKAGGLKNWGCSAFLVCLIVLAILVVPLHGLLTTWIDDPAAWWASLAFFGVVLVGVISFLVTRRRRQRKAQEQIWQQEIPS